MSVHKTKSIGLLFKFLPLSFVLLLLLFNASCVRCSKENYAIYLPNRGVIQLRDVGLIMSPTTPEGAFPDFSHVLTVELNLPFDEALGKKLFVGKEISVRYGYADAGFISVYRDKVDVHLNYANGYWGNHNGVLPLRNPGE